MGKRNHKIQTSNRELYHKFSQLNFFDEIALSKNVPLTAIKKILNTKKDYFELVEVGDTVIIKKLKPINFNMYLLGSKLR